MIRFLLFIAACSPQQGLRPPEAGRPPRPKPSEGAFEREYIDHIARIQQWGSEVTTREGTYCDLVSETHAIEVERVYGNSPYEAVGQSLHYSVQLDKQPGICFLIQQPSDKAYALKRMKNVAKTYGISVWWYLVADDEIIQWQP